MLARGGSATGVTDAPNSKLWVTALSVRSYSSPLAPGFGFGTVFACSAVVVLMVPVIEPSKPAGTSTASASTADSSCAALVKPVIE